MSAWIDCPETPPAPGWWWFRKPESEVLNPCELWIDLKERHVVGPAAWTWGEWRRKGWQMWPTPVAQPGAAPPPESVPRSTEQELRAWAADAERAHHDTSQPWPQGYRCAVSDVLFILDGGMRASASDEPDPEDVAGLGKLVCGLTRLEARERDATNLLDEKDGRLDAIEAHLLLEDPAGPSRFDLVETLVSDVDVRQLAELEKRVEKEHLRRSRLADLLVNRATSAAVEIKGLDRRLENHLDRLEALEADAEELGPLGRRLDDHVNRFEALEERLAKAETLLEGLRR